MNQTVKWRKTCLFLKGIQVLSWINIPIIVKDNIWNPTFWLYSVFFQFGEINIKKAEFKAHGLKAMIHLSFNALYLISIEGTYKCKI